MLVEADLYDDDGDDKRQPLMETDRDALRQNAGENDALVHGGVRMPSDSQAERVTSSIVGILLLLQQVNISPNSTFHRWLTCCI